MQNFPVSCAGSERVAGLVRLPLADDGHGQNMCQSACASMCQTGTASPHVAVSICQSACANQHVPTCVSQHVAVSMWQLACGSRHIASSVSAPGLATTVWSLQCSCALGPCIVSTPSDAASSQQSREFSSFAKPYC